MFSQDREGGKKRSSIKESLKKGEGNGARFGKKSPQEAGKWTKGTNEAREAKLRNDGQRGNSRGESTFLCKPETKKLKKDGNDCRKTRNPVLLKSERKKRRRGAKH